MSILVPLACADPAGVETLLDSAFGVDRHARTAYRLRAGTASLPDLSFAACDGATLVGTIQCWPIALAAEDGAAWPLVLVGPVAVAPPRQRDGLGRRLMERMLAAAGTCGLHDLLLIGDPGYYGRFFGFAAAPTAGWAVPGPVARHRLLARLAPGAAWPARGTLGPRRSQPAPAVSPSLVAPPAAG